jgi:phage I-like protein
MKMIFPMNMISCLLARETVTNEAEAREAAESNSADAPIDAVQDGWVKIAPFGTYPGSKPDRPQHFTESEANAMVTEFSSLRGKLGRMFRGIPIYIGHPDKNPDIYTDHRRLGRINDLEVRPDGLYGEPEWNSLGEENLREGYWVFPSPRWDAPVGRREFRPDRLISVGLTNSPRIADSEPITNSTLDDTESPTNEIMDRKLLCETLGLDVTATDEEILAKIASLNSAAADAEAKLTEKTGEMETVKTEKDEMANSIIVLTRDLVTAREALANSLLDAATADGRITQADRTAWLPRLTGEQCEEEVNALGALKPQLNTTSIDVERSRVEIGDEKQRRETIANAVDAIMKEKGLPYDDAWLLAKKDPALKGVWEAMRTEG